MQYAAVASSPSTAAAAALLNKCRLPPLLSPNLRTVATLPLKSLPIHGFSRRFVSKSLTGGTPDSPLSFRRGGVARASSGPDGGGESGGANPGGSTLYMGLLVVFWYLFNIYFSIYNKQVMKVYQYPLTITAFQFAVGTVLTVFMWGTNICKRPDLSSSQILTILPLAFGHTMGNLCTNLSVAKVPVSFTQTIKAMEPFFSVILSTMFLGEVPTLWVLSSLVPIVGGVALASLTETSFNWIGFLSAMASNLANQSRNVFSKKLMGNKEEPLDDMTLFSVITVMSFLMSAPLALFVEGIKFTPSFVLSSGLNVREIYVKSLLAGLCFQAYQQLSYMILTKVSPVTHSVANCLKRAVVIVAAVLVFKTHVTAINCLGTGVALAGVFLYSRAKRIRPKFA